MQQPGKIPRIGYLGFGTAAALANRVEAMRAGLRDLGYVEGKNMVIEFRWAGTVEHLQEAAAELAAMKVDVIFATSSTETERARKVTSTIPIVFATHADPVGLGHVASLPRPGGNITGLSMLLTELAAKELEILKETLPHATRFGVLLTSTAPSHHPAEEAVQAAGEKLGVQLRMARVRATGDLDGAFATMAREGVGGFLAVASPLTRVQRARLAELALKHRLPGMFGTKENVEAGGLMSYAPDLVDLTRRAAVYIDKILKGAKRPAGRAGFPVPAGHQFEDRQCARTDDPAFGPDARRRGDRVTATDRAVVSRFDDASIPGVLRDAPFGRSSE